MIRTQSRVRVRVIYLNQRAICHQILGGVGIRVMRSRSDAPTDENKTSNVRSFIIVRSGERVTSFTKDNNANFSSEKW